MTWAALAIGAAGCLRWQVTTPVAAALSLDRDFVATHGYGTPGSYVLLTVSDSGTGMLPEVSERLFDPFFTTKPDGTGLGLAVSKKIIDDHGGAVDVTSRPGKTVFKLSFPRGDKP